MEYELWLSLSEKSYTYLPKDKKYHDVINREKQITPDIHKIWSYHATSHYDAMQAYNDYLGFGKYIINDNEPDTFY